VGYGRVGKRIGEVLQAQGIPFVVAEQNRERVDQLRRDGIDAVSGDAETPDVLIQAHIAHATMLVIAIPDTLNVRKMVQESRLLNPNLQVGLRTHNEEEAELLRQESLGQVFLGEHELARGMSAHILAQLRPASAAAAATSGASRLPGLHGAPGLPPS